MVDPSPQPPPESRPWVPGRIVGGCCLVIAPLFWTAGLVVQWLARQRADLTAAELQHLGAEVFAAPMLLVVHDREPGLSTAGSALLAVGILTLVPAMLAIAHAAAGVRPMLAQAAALLITAGLMARMFYLGIDATAFNLVERLGAEAATPLILDGYSELAHAYGRIPIVASVGTIVGSVLLALAVHLAGIWGTGRCLLIMPAAWLEMGVLKEYEPGLGGVALAIALVPVGLSLLRGTVPRRRPLPSIGRRLPSWLQVVLSW